MTIITQTNLVTSNERTTQHAKNWRHSGYHYTVKSVIYDHELDAARVTLENGMSALFDGADHADISSFIMSGFVK